MQKHTRFIAILAAGLAAFTFAGAASTLFETSDTTVIKHKKGFAPVLTLTGDRGIGLVIDQHNKSATGIRMDSGNARLELSPSYVAAGLKSDDVGTNAETGAAVFKVDGPKGGRGFVAFDVETQEILWFNIAGELTAVTYPNLP